jgi:amino acid transporter
MPQVRRWDLEDYDDYPYRSFGQPFTAYAGLIGCLFLLFVCNGAALWNGWHQLPFLSSYLIVCHVGIEPPQLTSN